MKDNVLIRVSDLKKHYNCIKKLSVLLLSQLMPFLNGESFTVPNPSYTFSIQRKYPPRLRWVFSWRRLRDLNPRDGYPPYALSRGASSANLSKSPDEVNNNYSYKKCGL